MEKKKKPNRKHRRKTHQSPSREPNPSSSDSDSDSSPPSSPTSIRRLLEPYSKPRLLSLLASAADANPNLLLPRIRAAADASPSHRRLFVHGLPPNADDASLAAAFSRFGPLAEHHVVSRRATGECKGYGFVTFRSSRAAARRALREVSVRRVVVAGRAVSAQFASAGVGAEKKAAAAGEVGRRVYVTNVAPDASAERLRAFFAGFGEIEGGPYGFDGGGGETASRGYALFVYRSAAGAMRAIEEPYRVFEGRTLRCQLAAVDPARKSKPCVAAPAPTALASVALPTVAATPVLQPVIDAVVASGVGDLAMYAKNPAQAAALLGKNPILAAAVLNSALASTKAAGTLSPAAVSSINPAMVVARSPVAAPAIKPSLVAPRSQSPAVAVEAVVPSQVKIDAGISSAVAATAVVISPAKNGAGISSGAGLLGPYKPPSSLLLASSIGGKERS